MKKDAKQKDMSVKIYLYSIAKIIIGFLLFETLISDGIVKQKTNIQL